jgi:hypothetical protein
MPGRPIESVCDAEVKAAGRGLIKMFSQKRPATQLASSTDNHFVKFQDPPVPKPVLRTPKILKVVRNPFNRLQSEAQGIMQKQKTRYYSKTWAT